MHTEFEVHIIIFQRSQTQFNMNKKKSFERKITLQSSDHSDHNPHKEAKCALNRISSLKWLSFKDIPFSQHIFPEEPTYQLKVSSATSFNPERWNFQPKREGVEKQFELKQAQKATNNLFMQARLACVNKKKEKKALLKRTSLAEQVDHGMIDEVLTYRIIKKNEGLVQQTEQIKTLI